MVDPQNSPEERINEDPEEGTLGRSEREIPPSTRRVSVLLSLDLPPSCATDHWPTHILFADSRYAGALWGLLDNWIGNGTATDVGTADTTPIEQDSESPVIYVNAADNLKIHEQDGHIGVYERFPRGDLKLVKEFPDRDPAEAYIEEIRQMGQASNQIGEAYSVMVRQWVIEKAEETGLEPRLVREFIGGIID